MSTRYAPGMEKPKKKNRQQVYTLLVQVGRKENDGLPDGATGAGLMIYASGVDEAEAVRETVAILKQADMAPLDVSGYGTLKEREAEVNDINKSMRKVNDIYAVSGLLSPIAVRNPKLDSTYTVCSLHCSGPGRVGGQPAGAD